jgi:hypothetical protein
MSSGLTVTGSSAWLTSHANRVPPEWSSTSEATSALYDALAEHAGGDPWIVYGNQPAHSGVLRQGVVEGAGRLRVGPWRRRRHVLNRVGAQDDRSGAGAAKQQGGPAAAVDSKHLRPVRADREVGAAVLVAAGAEGQPVAC